MHHTHRKPDTDCLNLKLSKYNMSLNALKKTQYTKDMHYFRTYLIGLVDEPSIASSVGPIIFSS